MSIAILSYMVVFAAIPIGAAIYKKYPGLVVGGLISGLGAVSSGSDKYLPLDMMGVILGILGGLWYLRERDKKSQNKNS